jgi:hypothetical protein
MVVNRVLTSEKSRYRVLVSKVPQEGPFLVSKVPQEGSSEAVLSTWLKCENEMFWSYLGRFTMREMGS